ncbi:Polyphenol oxidase [Morus notabilis]|uniref:Polyphenol oxidase n=1 Tax=Morus notabilis TaxID=981085 RepID=W9S4Y8_9ROSA|nr:Polyphenol oxidase [Morus notabilis]
MASFFLTKPLISTTTVPKTSFLDKSQTPNNTSDAKRKSKALSSRSSLFSCMACWEGNDQQNPTPNSDYETALININLPWTPGNLPAEMCCLWRDGRDALQAAIRRHCQSTPSTGYFRLHSDFVPPPVTCLRVRQPAHSVSYDYIAKYNTVTQLMKNLPPEFHATSQRPLCLLRWRLYVEKRSITHQPPTTVNLNYDQDPDYLLPPEKQVAENLSTMYKCRDPIFFAHHANVDRMWNIWKTLGGGKRKDITKKDFLDSEFLFYNENAQLVRVKIRDCLDTKALGHMFTKRSSFLGRTKSPPPISSSSRDWASRAGLKVQGGYCSGAEAKEEEEEEEQVLVVEGIGFDTLKPVRLDVYVNTEFAGSFIDVPHNINPGGDQS